MSYHRVLGLGDVPDLTVRSIPQTVRDWFAKPFDDENTAAKDAACPDGYKYTGSSVFSEVGTHRIVEGHIMCVPRGPLEKGFVDAGRCYDAATDTTYDPTLARINKFFAVNFAERRLTTVETEPAVERQVCRRPSVSAPPPPTQAPPKHAPPPAAPPKHAKPPPPTPPARRPPPVVARRRPLPAAVWWVTGGAALLGVGWMLKRLVAA